ncbi:MAG: 4-hydroxy-3-methylbut-2-enyl diphosphate reductase [Desulfovibrio sp.]
MKVLRAETAGFCMGVSLALKKLDELVANALNPESIYMLGPIIHNPQVLERYKKVGVQLANSIHDIPAESTVIIRAHGIPLKAERHLKENNIHIIDATCPKVKKAQVLIQKQAALNKTLLLYGEEDHPEVRGLLSYSPEHAYVFEDLDDLKKIELPNDREYFLAAQTTQDKEHFVEISDWLQKNLDEDIHILHTICDATRERQHEAIKIAQEVDCMVVVGGKSSGNTRRLHLVATSHCNTCYHIETVEELKEHTEFKSCMCLGLTAGASTPKDIIDTVEKHLQSL